MTPRKATYTPEEAKARHLEQIATYNKENTTTINLRMPHLNKAIYEQYRAWKGIKGLATMVRVCVERCMRLDGWTYQPETGQGAEAESEADQAEEQVQQ